MPGTHRPHLGLAKKNSTRHRETWRNYELEREVTKLTLDFTQADLSTSLSPRSFASSKLQILLNVVMAGQALIKDRLFEPVLILGQDNLKNLVS
jgi:hypothetical protein